MLAKHREPLLKGKAQYSWLPCSNKFRLGACDIANIIYFLNKTSYLKEEVNRTKPFPLVSVPCPASQLFSTNWDLYNKTFYSSNLQIKV
jgi:hypothetical protein